MSIPFKTRPTTTEVRQRVEDVFRRAWYMEYPHGQILADLKEEVYEPLSDKRIRGRLRLLTYVRGLVEGHLCYFWKEVVWASRNPETGVFQIASYDVKRVPADALYQWTGEFDQACVDWEHAHVWPKSGKPFNPWAKSGK